MSCPLCNQRIRGSGKPSTEQVRRAVERSATVSSPACSSTNLTRAAREKYMNSKLLQKLLWINLKPYAKGQAVFNIHGSHFSGLTKFPDFSSIFFPFFQCIFEVLFLTENLTISSHFQSVQNSLTGKCLPIFQVFQSKWEPWIGFKNK